MIASSEQSLKNKISVCLQCGQEFRPTHKNQKFCSIACVGISQRKLYICKNCGIEFNLKSGGKGIFCSRECSFDYIHKNKKQKEPKPLVSCVICGSQFKGKGNSKFCSDHCRREFKRIRFKENFVSVKETNLFIEKQCPECGNIFKTNYYAKRKKFCSDECCNRYFQREYKMDRKEQLQKAYIEPVSFKKIYKRDKAICQICGEYVEYDKTPTNPMGATIDHIIPLSKGGLHCMSNCQLAHRRCNSLKGSKIDYFHEEALIGW
ncbi:HNH endonuclease [Sporomusa ovata DSM 2662]|uniref:Phage-associated HNH homing endonuclease \|nr:HNH endonuclease [Sporomusa ovata]EQB24735.1 restriction endonuclease [Sporomusa ovata DSM 2662]CQR75081.1 Phage-associated HNH homing endonuclease \